MSRRSSLPPNLLENFDAAVGGLCADSLALVTDFDGTLSEFVPDLANAVIQPEALVHLRRLANILPLTAVMSGRAARDVESRVGLEDVVYVGNHGAEEIEGGVLRAVAEAEPAGRELQSWLERLADAANDPGLVLENKRFSASLHYRRAYDEERVIVRLRSAIEDFPPMGEFEFSWGNKILEIRPRNGVDKGVALGRLIDAWCPASVIFLGDDTTDGDALRMLKERSASGDIGGIGIAVIQEGTPVSVLASADYSLNGVPEVAEFLGRLVSLID